MLFFRGKQYSSTETLTTTETVHSFTVQSEKERPQYIPSLEQHSTTLVTEVPSKYDVMPEMKAHEHYATTITTDLQPKYQPVDLTISVPIPPKFLEALKTITALEGTKVTFEGVVTGKLQMHPGKFSSFCRLLIFLKINFSQN